MENNIANISVTIITSLFILGSNNFVQDMQRLFRCFGIISHPCADDQDGRRRLKECTRIIMQLESASFNILKNIKLMLKRVLKNLKVETLFLSDNLLVALDRR